MSDHAPPSPEALDPAASRWLGRLEQAPDEALDDLLHGKVWLGAYGNLSVSESVSLFLPASEVETFDGALQRWLNRELQRAQQPDQVSGRQYASALADAFALLQTLDLRRSRHWCRDHVVRLWHWLLGQPSFPAMEPRKMFLRALAIDQPNRDLQDFWMSLCRGTTKQWTQLALFGLRNMPRNDEGEMHEGLPPALIGGLIDYGVALAGRGDGNKKQWLDEVDFLSAVYPQSTARWTARWREALNVRTGSDRLRMMRSWLDERLPGVNQPSAVGQSPTQRLAPPFFDADIRPLLDKYDEQPARSRELLKVEIDRHHHYARESGDSYFLVRSFNQIADFLRRGARFEDVPRDAAWALALGKAAAHWSPSNHRCWFIIARCLEALGDWGQARAVYWYSRRRFPHLALSHNQLAHALSSHGLHAEGEAVLQAAIRRFPEDPAVRCELAHLLRAAGDSERAIEVLNQAYEKFSRDIWVNIALCSALIDVGDTTRAVEALEWTERILKASDREGRQWVDRVRVRLKRKMDGVPEPRPVEARVVVARGTSDWADLERISGIDFNGLDLLGSAALWRERQAGNDDLERAKRSLDEAAEVTGRDARWQSEMGLWISATQGWEAAADHFAQEVARRPGDGEMAAFQMLALQASGQVADWNSLRGRFEDLAPVIKTAADPNVKRPAEIEVALRETQEDAQLFAELDDELQQAVRVYQTANDPLLARMTQIDFLSARQLAVF